MKNYIDKSGIELEGYWENQPNGFKHDGSVEINDIDNECDGSCRDNCECYSYCECDECQNCNYCDNNIDNCQCYQCMKCRECDYNVEECECDRNIRHLEECDNKNCNNDNVCDNCINECYDEFDINQETYYSCSDTYGECSCECSCECECECECDIGGEIASPILESKEKINEFMLNNYPDIHNDTCGRHDHFSFKRDKLDVNLLTRKEFHIYLKQRLIEFGTINKINSGSRFWKRLNGSYYCKDEFKPEQQLRLCNDRYTHINFCSYRKFGTVEFRLSNIFDKKEISVKYTDELYDIINSWLKSQKVKIYEFEYKFNKNTAIYVRFNMVKDGLKIFVKTFGLEDLLKTQDNEKYYKNHLDFERLNFNETELYLDSGFCNMSFMRLVGQSTGKSMIIKNVFTDEELDKYYDNLTTQIPTLIKDIKGVNMICV